MTLVCPRRRRRGPPGLLPSGDLALGLLVVVATPLVRVAGLIVAFALERD